MLSCAARPWRCNSFARSELQQSAAQQHRGNREIDHQTGHIDKGRDKRRRCARRVETQTTQDKRQDRTGDGAPQDDTDQTESEGKRDEKVMIAVSFKKKLPE